MTDVTPITTALSPSARSYLAEVFECTTQEHLIRLGDDGPGSTYVNVFEENVAELPEDDTSLDAEIAAYLRRLPMQSKDGMPINESSKRKGTK